MYNCCGVGRSRFYVPFGDIAGAADKGLRESAEGDLEYVAGYCEAAGIPFEAVRVDAAGNAAENGLSVEEAARHLRYEALKRAAERWDRENSPQSCLGERQGSGNMPQSQAAAGVQQGGDRGISP